jgi:hypothetical protein
MDCPGGGGGGSVTVLVGAGAGWRQAFHLGAGERPKRSRAEERQCCDVRAYQAKSQAKRMCVGGGRAGEGRLNVELSLKSLILVFGHEFVCSRAYLCCE